MSETSAEERRVAAVDDGLVGAEEEVRAGAEDEGRVGLHQTPLVPVVHPALADMAADAVAKG